MKKSCVLVSAAILALGLLLSLSLFEPARALAQSDIDVRRREVLAQQIDKPIPGIVCGVAKGARDPCDYGLLYHALALFYLDRNEADRSRANDNLEEALSLLGASAQGRMADEDKDYGAAQRARPLHFQRGAMLYRIVRLFGSEGGMARGALLKRNEDAIKSLLGQWAAGHCRIDDADPTRTWRIWRSENHSAQLTVACWEAADLMRADPSMTYDDGSTVEAQHAAWTAFLMEYMRQRAIYGFAEYFSPTYTAYTLAAIYDLADFAGDPRLKQRASNLLQLWWAQWAEEQVAGQHGGSRARAYDEAISTGSPMRVGAWMYFGLGEEQRNTINSASLITSSFEPDPVVRAIATNAGAHAPYTVVTRAPSRVIAGDKRSAWTEVDPTLPGVVRTTYRGAGFIMGSASVPFLDLDQWYTGGSQNRMNTLVLDGGAVIAIASDQEGRKSSYNDINAVQDKGAMIASGMGKPYGSGASKIEVYFDPSLDLVERNGWVFADSSAYVAVKPLSKAYAWQGGGKRWLSPAGNDVAIVVQVSPKAEFADFAAFQAAVEAAPLTSDQSGMSYTSLDGGALYMPRGTGVPIQANGAELDFDTRTGIVSPFISANAAGDSFTVTIEGASLALSFQ